MLKVSFNISVESLLKAVAAENVGMDIQAYQSAVERIDTVDEAPLMLEDNSAMSLRELVLERLRHTGKPTKLADLRALAENNGHNPKSLSNVIYILCVKKLVNRTGAATYRITKRGMV